MRSDRLFLGLLLGVSGTICLVRDGMAQLVPSNIVPDETLGAGNSQVIQNYNDLPVEAIIGGTQRLQNLFHSFNEFNVSAGRGAYFAIENDAVRNVLMRVTGNNLSDIQGTLGTFRPNGSLRVPGVNLFLMNPNGIIFGSNASLDVGGSFVATTANAIQLGESGLFSASQPARSSLLTVNPSAFLFNAIAAQPIINQSQARQTVLGVPTLGLAVRNQQSLVIVGGDINLDGGQLFALGGQIDLISIQRAGTAEVVADDNHLAVKALDGAPRGNISLSNQAEIFVRSDLGGGDISISSRDFQMSGGSSLLAGSLPNSELLETKSGNIIINTTNAVKLGDSEIYNSLSSGSVGQAGNISIKTQFLEMSDRAQIGNGVFGQGIAGNISIEADQAISIKDSLEQVNQPVVGTGILNEVGSGGNGKAGTINIRTPFLSLTEGAQILASLAGQGSAGVINLSIGNSMIIDTGAVISSSISAGSEGNGGEINVKTGSLSLLNGASLLSIVRQASDSKPAGKGIAGNINIEARDQVTVSGIFSEEIPSPSVMATSIDIGATGKAGNINIKTGVFSLTEGAQIRSTLDLNASGEAGNIQVDAKTISVSRGGRISTATGGQGNAGDVLINAQESVIFDGTLGDFTGILTDAIGNARGNGGNLTVKTDSLLITNGSSLSTETAAAGKAGNIDIAARTLTVSNEATVSTASYGIGSAGDLNIQASDSVQVNQGGAIRTSSFENGNAGNLKIGTGDLIITSGSLLTTITLGSGEGGDLSISASNSLQVIGTTLDSQGVSGIFPITLGSGNAGDLRIDTKRLIVRGGATISSETKGSGRGGDLNINASESVEVIGTSPNGKFLTAITSETEQSGNAGNLIISTGRLLVKDGAYIAARGVKGSSGNAGNINLIATDSVIVNGRTSDIEGTSFISTETRFDFDQLLSNPPDPGSPGDITITTPRLKIINGGEIATQSDGFNKAGDINLDIGESLEINNGEISTVALFAIGGNISISARKVFLRGDGDIKTVVPFNLQGESRTRGGDITITADSIVALDDSDILAFARNGRGGTVKYFVSKVEK